MQEASSRACQQKEAQWTHRHLAVPAPAAAGHLRAKLPAAAAALLPAAVALMQMVHQSLLALLQMVRPQAAAKTLMWLQRILARGPTHRARCPRFLQAQTAPCRHPARNQSLCPAWVTAQKLSRAWLRRLLHPTRLSRAWRAFLQGQMLLHPRPGPDLTVLQALPSPRQHDQQLRQRPRQWLPAAAGQLLLLLLPQAVAVVGQSPCLEAGPAAPHAAAAADLALLLLLLG